MNADRPVAEKKILVVDDDPGLLLLAEAAFYNKGFEIYTASSGEEALSLVSDLAPDIILLDLMMPGIDGVRTCRRIKDIPELAHTPIIMLTGRDDVEAVERAYAAGAWDFTSKPVNWPILRHRVKSSLDASQAFRNEHNAARLSKTLDKTSNEIIVFDAESLTIRSANASALKNLGYTDDKLLKLDFSALAPDIPVEELRSQLRGLEEQDQINLSLNLHRGDGSSYPVDGIVLYSNEEQPHAYICIFQDNTERKRSERRLHRLAYYDDLTGLPNRLMFKQLVKQALGAAQRNNSACAICILDLDGFKSVNEAFGHSQGDLLLKQVTDRLTVQIRQNDSVTRLWNDLPAADPELEIARLGGDEFLVLLTNFEDSIVPAKVSDRILQSIARPFNLDGREITITASVGIALFPEDGDCLDVLMQHADRAMYAAKEAGKNGFTYYSRESGSNSLARLTLENELRRAVEREEFVLHYQPQVDGLNGRVVGAEALVRWQHPEKGLLGPGEFIQVAEESGLIIPIGDWVLRTAVEQLSRWADLYGSQFKCGVNVAALQLRQDEFLNATREMLRQKNGAAGSLVLELTESSLMASAKSRIDWLYELRELGAEIAIDDFGTGYSSLSYLRKLPIDYLKIDRSFVADLATNPDDRVITKTIFLMSQALGLQVVVEGVETHEQLAIVNRMGKSLIQGFVYSKALPVAEFDSWIDNQGVATGSNVTAIG